MKDNILYIEHIRDSIEKIETYINDVDYEQFVPMRWWSMPSSGSLKSLAKPLTI